MARRLEKHERYPFLTARFWRAFAFEVAVVVIGVLLALAATDWSEQRHLHAAAANARSAIWRDIALTEAAATERVAYAPCLVKFSDTVRSQLERTGDWPGLMAGGIDLSKLPPGMARRWPTEGWDGARSTDAVSQFGPEEAAAYALIASFTRDIASSETVANRALRELWGLKLAGPMSIADRRAALGDLAAYRWEARLTEGRAGHVLALIRSIGNRAPPDYGAQRDSAQKDLREAIAEAPPCAVEGLEEMKVHPPQ